MNDGSMAVHFTDPEVQPHSEVRMGPGPFQTQRNALMSRTTPYSTILLGVHKVFHNGIQAKFLSSCCHLSSIFQSNSSTPTLKIPAVAAGWQYKTLSETSLPASAHKIFPNHHQSIQAQIMRTQDGPAWLRARPGLWEIT